jgi:hypothetical protein
LIASAHGKSRVINPEDCTVDPLTPNDFPEGCGIRGLIFIHYVKISEILYNICRIRRDAVPNASKKRSAALEVSEWARSLPLELRLYDLEGLPRPYHFEVAQLHVLFFSAVCVLFRPNYVSTICSDNTAAVLASSLSYRLFHAFQLRDQIVYLGPNFSWNTFVLAMPQLACLALPSFHEEAESILNGFEGIMHAIETRWPSAGITLHELRKLRKGAGAAARHVQPTGPGPADDLSWLPFPPKQLFEPYGRDTIQCYERIYSCLAAPEIARATSPDSLNRPQASAAGLQDGYVPDECPPASQNDAELMNLPVLLTPGDEISFDTIDLSWFDNRSENTWMESDYVSFNAAGRSASHYIAT